MQSTKNSGCFLQGKRAAIVRCYTALFFSMCALFLWFHAISCEAYSFTTVGYVIFNVRTNLGAYCTHEEGSGTNMSAQGIEKLSLTLPHEGLEPRVFGFEFRPSNH